MPPLLCCPCVWSLVKQVVHLQLKCVISVLIELSPFRPHQLSLCVLARQKGQQQSLLVLLVPQNWRVLCMAPKGKLCAPACRGLG